jgi:hypothetical protein
LKRPNEEKIIPKNKAENIQGILRYFSNKKPSPNEKEKVTAIKRKTNSKAKNPQKHRFPDNFGLSKQFLLSFVAPSDYPVKRFDDAYNFSPANRTIMGVEIQSHCKERQSLLLSSIQNVCLENQARMFGFMDESAVLVV